MTPETFTAFHGEKHLLSGSLLEIASKIRQTPETARQGILIFSDLTGKARDIDIWGTDDAIRKRFGANTAEPQIAEEPRGRGRPKLGVIAREITLLPRHWDWLNAQPGGASVSLRKLVDEARAKNGNAGRIRQSREAAYHFMLAIAGDFPHFEEATRALFAGNRERFTSQLKGWPADIRRHALALAFSQTESTVEKA